MTLPNGTIIEYPQDALNRRVAKKINGQVAEKYLWADLTTLLAVYDKDDHLIQRFEYADMRMPLAMTNAQGQKYYLHYDQVGSLRAVSDTQGNIIKEIAYDTYGNVLSDTNPSLEVPFGFAGGLYDSDTKLTHFGYREYDAYTGKWTAKDPIGFAGGDSNLYGYVLGDPVNWVDPKGLENFDPMTGIPTDIMQPIYDWFDDMFGEKPPAPPSAFDKIVDGLCTDIPEALRGFGNGLDRLNNLDRNNMSPLEEGLFDYLYINQKRVLNESETPINLIDKVETVNDFNNMRK